MEKLVMADYATMLDNRWTVNNIRTKMIVALSHCRMSHEPISEDCIFCFILLLYIYYI